MVRFIEVTMVNFQVFYIFQVVCDYLDENFPQPWARSSFAIEMPPQSPDFTVLLGSVCILQDKVIGWAYTTATSLETGRKNDTWRVVVFTNLRMVTFFFLDIHGFIPEGEDIMFLRNFPIYRKAYTTQDPNKISLQYDILLRTTEM
jgi:hypothetical protein